MRSTHPGLGAGSGDGRRCTSSLQKGISAPGAHGEIKRFTSLATLTAAPEAAVSAALATALAAGAAAALATAPPCKSVVSRKFN
jgi:hypothetical protein